MNEKDCSIFYCTALDLLLLHAVLQMSCTAYFQPLALPAAAPAHASLPLQGGGSSKHAVLRALSAAHELVLHCAAGQLDKHIEPPACTAGCIFHQLICASMVTMQQKTQVSLCEPSTVLACDQPAWQLVCLHSA
jgi:hypothetical protein